MKLVHNVIAAGGLLLAAMTANAQSVTSGSDAGSDAHATATAAVQVAQGGEATKQAQNLISPQEIPNIGMPMPAPNGMPPSERLGPLAGVGNWLENYGVNLGLVFTNGYFANPSTGISPGKSGNYGALFMSATIDLDKLIGLPNTQLNFTEAWNKPSHNTKGYLFQTGSAFTPFPVVPESLDLVKFTLSHDLFDRRLHLEYGRMNLTDNFMVTTMCSGCVVSTPAITLNAPGVTKSVWGARASWQFTNNTKLGLGVIEDNSSNWTATEGWNWGTSTRTGYIGVANVMHETNFMEQRLPTRYEVGVYHATAPYTDTLYNTDGTSQALNPTGTPLKHTGGTWGFYGQGRQVIWRDAESHGPVPRNVAVYGGAFITPGAGQSYPIEAYAGMEYGGFLANNPAALVGSTVRYIRLSNERSRYEQQARYSFTNMLSMMSGGALSTVNETVPQNTFTFDVHGQMGIAPGVLLQGFAQYFVHPNTSVLAQVSTSQSRSGWMLGAFLVIDIGRLSGLVKM
ncbi:carbohydrate porin [Pandoraea bronchicola]|uniref:Carbohydrate porin n=1 Tax=Pandoraea bronchicola TaxID=2508287 RepID=A0A5E5C1I9_9BURK|nr:carbohydrate porin [Pandoraea bronchicola]VVE90490.1 carbohydrate porin [Pandoraea bronchicola]